MMETLRYIVFVNGLLAVISVAYYALLRRETFFNANRLALWLGVAGSLLLPLLNLPDWRPQPIRTAMQQTARAIVPKLITEPTDSPSGVTITFPNKRTFEAFQARQKRVVWSWQTHLLALYTAVVLFLLIRFGSQLLSLKKLIHQSVYDPYDDFILVRNETVTSPFSFFHWVVLNPNQHTSDELDQILRHERVHVRDRHSVDMLFAEMICIVFWFNPAIYLFRNLLHQTLEFSADRAVLAEGVEAKAYQYNLLKVSLSAGQSAITNHFSKTQLKLRIAMINQPNSSKAAWLNYPIFFIAVLTVASAFARSKPVIYFPNPVVEPVAGLKVSVKKFVKPVLKTKRIEPAKLKNVYNDKSAPHAQDVVYEELPEASYDVAVDYLPITADSTDDKKMEAMILEGQRKYGHLGIGPRRFDKEEIKRLSTPGSYLKINPDGSLSVDETASYARVFINNEPVAPQAVRSLTINQLYALTVIYGHKPEGQEKVGTRYILFYADKGN
ncbi:M56 family metallopeptidase [Spirosoma lituiforme]